MHRNTLLLLSLVCISPAVLAQSFKIYGKVTNAKLEPLAFVSIQVKDMQDGVITKENGSYELKVDDGVYELVISMMGYKSQVLRIAVNKSDYEQNIILDIDETKSLSEVIVKGKIKDRSEEVIRQVIRRKEAIQLAAGSYSATAYIKAIQEDSSARKRKKRPAADTIVANADLMRMAMIEIALRFDHTPDGKIKETREGVKRRGNADELFYTSVTDGEFDLYNNLVSIPKLSSTPFLSPISYSGLIAYRYKMLKTETKGNHKIYTISIKPGKLSNATMEGVLTISDSSWTLLHTQFTLPRYHLGEYDLFEVEQDYQFVNNTAWMISRQQFTYFSKTNKAKKSGTTIITYKDFELNKTFDRKYFGPELSTATTETYKRDTSFWNQARTEPLTEKEIRFVRYRDSIYNATHTKNYLDSIDRLTNKVTWKKVLIFGQPIYSREKERLWMIQSLLSFYQPFQLGGARIMPSLNYNKTYPSKKNISLYANFSYGFRNKDLNGNISFSKLYNPVTRGFYQVRLRRDFEYIFRGDAWINMIKRSNFYLDNSFGLTHNIEIANGLYFRTDLDFAARSSVARLKTNSTIDDLLGDLLEENQPIAFSSYNATYGGIELRYTPKQRYIREPFEKVILGSKWPTFYSSWRKGIPRIMNSKVDFDYLEYGIQQSVKLGLLGTSSYTFRTGSFLTRKDLRLVDYKFQRRGDPLLLLNPNEAFQDLDSTFPVFKRFYEGHYYHEFNGALLNKIPLFKKLQLREVAGAGILYAPERNLRYAELLAGVERVFKAPFNIPTKVKMGVYIVGSASNQFSNPVHFKIGFTTWDRQRGKWF